jgi:hypothetical protein
MKKGAALHGPFFIDRHGISPIINTDHPKEVVQ